VGAGLSSLNACQDFKEKTTGRLFKLLAAPALSGHSIYFFLYNIFGNFNKALLKTNSLKGSGY